MLAASKKAGAIKILPAITADAFFVKSLLFIVVLLNDINMYTKLVILIMLFYSINQ